MLKKLALAFLTSLLLVGSASAASLVTGASESVEGNSNNNWPFGGGNPYQQIYDSSYFSGPMTISGLAFRTDQFASGTFALSMSNISITLSTSNFDWLSASSSIAANTGADAVSVFAGAKSFNISTVNSPAKPFDVIFDFANTFDYDPANGDLAVNIAVSGYSETPNGHYLDAQSGPGMTRIFGGGQSKSFGLVTQFTYEPASTVVPLPAALPLMAGGLGLLGVMGWRRKKAA